MCSWYWACSASTVLSDRVAIATRKALSVLSAEDLVSCDQGDVGCGKTIVALLVSAIIVGDESQVAIMAPTEILAEQHYESFIKSILKRNSRPIKPY